MLLGLITLTAGLLNFMQPAVHAALAFNVNSVGDGADSNPADNICNDGSGNCTLRAAIEQANAAAGVDTINFSVTGTINLTGALPDIVDSLTINGPGSSLLTVRRDTGGDYRIFTVTREDDRSTLVVAISGLTVANGKTEDGFAHAFADSGDPGGGILNGGVLTLTGVTLTGNRTGAGGAGGAFAGDGGDGGAIQNFGTLTLTNVTMTGNSTGAGGAGPNAGNAGDGGAVSNFGGVLTMTGCVVRGNSTGRGGASNNSAGGDGGDGGGVHSFFGMLVMTNCTVSENIIGVSGTGGGGKDGKGAGIYDGHGAILTGVTVSNNAAGAGVHFDSGFSSLTNSTITANTGPGVNTTASELVVRNTIIAGNGGGSGPDVTGTFKSQGHNLIGNAGVASGFTAAGDQVGTSAVPINPRLGPLADNGGNTPTHALLAGSPALDAGNNALALDRNNNPLTTDQRGAGFARFADGPDADTTQTVDIGAFEAHPSVEDIADKATNPGTPLSFSFNVGDAALGISSVTAASSNQALLPDANLSISGAGSTYTLQLTPAAGATGSATVTLTVTGSNGRSASDTFVLGISGVNSAPAFTKGADQTVAEDSGPQTIPVWATGISPGPPSDAGQSVAFVVTGNTNPGLFSAAPSVSPGGTLAFTPAPDANGSASITLVLKDDGGTTGGGHDTSAPQTFNVNVTPVNDAPVNSVPAAQTTGRQTPLVFSGPNAISIADVDAGASPIKVTLRASPGTLTLGSTAGLVITPSDRELIFTGSLANVNAALNGLTFRPEQGFIGDASILLSTDDQGNTGSGGAKTDFDIINVSVTNVPGGTLEFFFFPEEVFEGSPVTFNVGRNFGSEGATSVDFATSGGTAVGGAACGAGVDYVSASGTLTWDNGDATSKLFIVNLCNDSLHGADKTLRVTLTNLKGTATLGTPSKTITIKDNNTPNGLIEFTQAAYVVGEGSGSLTVTVGRTGNTGSATSVDYATDANLVPGLKCSDRIGVALDRCDFTRAVGRLVFAPGETEKTFQILLSDDSYVEDGEVTFIRLSNPGGGFALGQFATATLAISDDLPETSANPIDASEKFVRQHYHDFLGRAPDAAGLAFWTNEIEKCGVNAQCREAKRVNVSAAFFLSIEFQETGFLAYKAHKAAFGNITGTPIPIRYLEMLSDAGQIGAGVVVNVGDWLVKLEQNKVEYFNAFVASDTFAARYPASMTPEAFVDSLNANAGGALSPPERQSLIDELKGGSKTRAQALRAVAEDSDLHRAETNRAFVLMQYFGYLRRDPDAPGFDGQPDPNFNGYNFWLGKLNGFNGNFVQAEMVKAFIISTEYRQRFGQ